MISIITISNINNKNDQFDSIGEKGYLSLLREKKNYQVLIETDRTVRTSLFMLSIIMLSLNVIARLFHVMDISSWPALESERQ